MMPLLDVGVCTRTTHQDMESACIGFRCIALTPIYSCVGDTKPDKLAKFGSN